LFHGLKPGYHRVSHHFYKAGILKMVNAPELPTASQSGTNASSLDNLVRNLVAVTDTTGMLTIPGKLIEDTTRFLVDRGVSQLHETLTKEAFTMLVVQAVEYVVAYHKEIEAELHTCTASDIRCFREYQFFKSLRCLINPQLSDVVPR
jgi:hypothetical protein